MSTQENRFDWGNFLLGLLFIGISFVAFRNPSGSLASLTVIIGISAIAKGLFDIFLRNRLKHLTGVKSSLLIVTGILDIIFGGILLFNINVGMISLAYVFAAWFLVDSISGLFSLDLARAVSTTYYWFNLIVTILGIFVGISLLFNPLTSALTLSFLVGFYLMWFGILNLVKAFL